MPFTTHFVRIMLLDSEHENVLMQYADGRWDLPYLVFPSGLRDDAANCCLKFQELLGHHSDFPSFSGVVELLGDIGCMRPCGYNAPVCLGYAKLLFVEPCAELDRHRFDFRISLGAKHMLNQSLDGYERFCETMGQLLRVCVTNKSAELSAMWEKGKLFDLVSTPSMGEGFIDHFVVNDASTKLGRDICW